MELKLTLPVPTSLNKLYINQYSYNPKKGMRVPTGKRILSQEGVKCKNEIQAETLVQMQGQDWCFEWTNTGYVYLDTIIYFQRRGSDDNNIYKLLCDALEGICYSNDSRVLVRTQKIMYSTHNPRVEVKISPVEYIGIFDNGLELENFENNCTKCNRYRNGSCSILKDSISGTEREEITTNAKICSSFRLKK